MAERLGPVDYKIHLHIGQLQTYVNLLKAWVEEDEPPEMYREEWLLLEAEDELRSNEDDPLSTVQRCQVARV